MRGLSRILLVAVGLLVGVWLLGTGTAAAHAVVVNTTPQAATQISNAPAELRVDFSEAVRPLGQALTLQGPNGQVRLGPVRQPDGRVLAATLPALADGSYIASWQIVSADDGHVEASSFTFAIGPGAGPVASPAPQQLPSGPVASPAPHQLPSARQVAGRWLETAGVLLLVGVVTAALTIWRRPGPIGPDEPRYRRLTVVAVVLAAVGLAWQVAAGAATSGGLGPGAVGAFLSASPATVRRMVIEVVLLAATAGLVWRGARRGRRPGLGALAATVGVVIGMALGGHETGLTPRWLFIPLEVVHLLAAGAWIGGLAVLALTARRAGIEPLRRFSVLALRAVVVVAATGIWQGVVQVSSRAALAGTAYGRALTVKTAIFLAMLGLAAVARLRLLPRAVADRPTSAGTPGGLRRLLAVEATGGAVVVVVAALLANTVPASKVLAARAATSAANIAGGPQTQVVDSGPLRLQVGLEPGTVGRNLLEVQISDTHGLPVDGLANVYLTITDPAGASATANATRVGPATYRAVTDAFTLPGLWQVGVEVPGASPDLAFPFGIAATPATSGGPPPDPPDAVVLGGRTRSALVGLTAMTAGHLLVVRARGGFGVPPAVAPRPLRVLGPDGRPVTELVQPCGERCAEAFLTAPARGPLTVEAVLPFGTTRFTLPLPLPRPAAARLRAADRTLAASKSFRIHEVLDNGFGTVYRTDYVLAAPDRVRWHLDAGSGTADTVWIGEHRWSRDGRHPWKLEVTDNQIRWPARNWSDFEGNVTDLGPATWHASPVDVLAFIDTPGGAFHRLWVDHANRILHERVDAPEGFVDRDYTDYDTPVTITAPQ